MLKKWIEDYYSDFTDELLQVVKSFMQDMRNNGDMSLANHIQTALQRYQQMTTSRVIEIFDLEAQLQSTTRSKLCFLN